MSYLILVGLRLEVRMKINKVEQILNKVVMFNYRGETVAGLVNEVRARYVDDKQELFFIIYGHHEKSVRDIIRIYHNFTLAQDKNE